jgi:hypothetical protein
MIGRVAIACAILVGSATRASADADISAITAALDSSDYPAARELVTKALAAGHNSPETTIELYRLQGVVEGSLGETQVATDAFSRALALAPKLTLPAGTSPKIAKPFEAARNFYKSSAPLKVRIETTAVPPRVRVVVQSDPMKMIKRARVSVIIDGKPEQTLDSAADVIPLPAGRRLDLRVAILDANNNRLVEIGSTDVPIVILSTPAPEPKGKVVVTSPPSPPPPPVPSSRPIYARWYVWGGLSLAAAITGGAFGLAALSAKSDLDALNANSRMHSFDEALAVEDSIRTRLLVTNISLGVAIGAGAAATLLFVLQPRAAERANVTVVPERGGGSLVIGGEF